MSLGDDVDDDDDDDYEGKGEPIEMVASKRVDFGLAGKKEEERGINIGQLTGSP